MKRNMIWTGMALAALVMACAGATVWAQETQPPPPQTNAAVNGATGQGDPGVPPPPPPPAWRGMGMGRGTACCPNFQDRDGNGQCDNFTDQDGDGWCDRRPVNPPTRRGPRPEVRAPDRL